VNFLTYWQEFRSLEEEEYKRPITDPKCKAGAAWLGILLRFAPTSSEITDI